MQIGIGLSLARHAGGGLDADAAAYISAVEDAGASVSATQKGAINAFVKTGKSDGWYSSIKRLYLPIWASAAPNAICMTSLTSGTFVGTLTHSSGYVTTDGSTGHFLSDVSPGGAGLTLNGSAVFALFTAESSLNLINTESYFGAQEADNTTRFRNSGNGVTTAFAFFGPNSANFGTALTAGDQRGVQFFGRDTSTNRFISLRNASGVSSDNQANTSGNINSTIPMCWFANNINGSVSGYAPNTVQMGLAGMSDGLSQATAETVTDALKTLWETCTGLVLP